MTPTRLTALLSIFIFLFVIDLIRRQKLTFKYSLFWLSSSVAAILISLKPTILDQLSELAGFELPSNFIFFCLMLFFTTATLLLTIYINQQDSRNNALIQSLAILSAKVKELEKRK